MDTICIIIVVNKGERLKIPITCYVLTFKTIATDSNCTNMFVYIYLDFAIKRRVLGHVKKKLHVKKQRNMIFSIIYILYSV